MTLSSEFNESDFDSDFMSIDAVMADDHDSGDRASENPRERARPVSRRGSPVQPFALPSQPSPLIGRDALFARVTAYLDGARTRLVTLVGPGGVGKTRLACEIARHREREHEIVRFIDLAELHDCASVAEVIHEALGPALPMDEPLEEQHLIVLGNPRALLVLDNFEHVIAAAPYVAELLSDAPWLQIIVTSRIPLRLRWELACPVPPLATPSDGQLPPLSELAAIPSIALFLAFVRRHDPDIALTVENARIVAEICRRMDGLPLALELAAAGLKMMPIERLRERVERPLDALVRGPRDLPPRQQTMRATIEWSYALLPEVEQRIVQQLAIFAGGASISAVADIMRMSLDGAYDVLANLADQSLLEIVEEPHAEPRFRMPRMVREYLAERLATDDNRDALRGRFVAYYLRLAEDACSGLGGARADAAPATLLAELGNLREILSMTTSNQSVTNAIRLALTLMPLWSFPGQLAEGRRAFERLLALMPDGDPALTAEACVAAARLAIAAGDVHAAHRLLEDARIGSDPLDQTSTRATILIWSCYVRLLRGDIDGAAHVLETAPELRAAHLDARDDITPGYLRAVIAAERRERNAGDLLADALAAFDQAANHEGAIAALCMRSELALLAGDTGSAAQLCADALVRARIAGNPRARIQPLIGLGDVAERQSSTDEAVHHYHEAFDIARAYDDERAQVQILERMAVLGVSSRIVPSLLRLIGLADTMRARLGVGRSTFEELLVAPRLEHARHMLGEDEFARIHAEGEALPLARIVAEFDAGTRWSTPVAAPKGLRAPSTMEQLTRREREVVQQISKGYTNRQIAVNLGMAERTVDSHIGNIRQKLQLPSRARIAVWAVANGLSSPD